MVPITVIKLKSWDVGMPWKWEVTLPDGGSIHIFNDSRKYYHPNGKRIRAEWNDGTILQYDHGGNFHGFNKLKDIRVIYHGTERVKIPYLTLYCRIHGRRFVGLHYKGRGCKG